MSFSFWVLVTSAVLVGCEIGERSGGSDVASESSAAAWRHNDSVETLLSLAIECDKDSASYIAHIDAYVAEVDGTVRMRRDSVEVWDRSTQGGHVVGSWDSLGYRRLDVVLYGETGRSTFEIYLRDRRTLYLQDGRAPYLRYQRPVRIRFEDMSYDSLFDVKDPVERARITRLFYLCDTTIKAQFESITGDTSAIAVRSVFSGTSWQNEIGEYLHLLEPAIVDDYVALLERFLRQEMLAEEFARTYSTDYLSDNRSNSEALFYILDGMFGDVESFQSDPKLRKELNEGTSIPGFYIDEIELRRSVAKALAALAQHKAILAPTDSQQLKAR